jgi:hypothetical protein
MYILGYGKEERGTSFRFRTGAVGFSALQGVQTGPGIHQFSYSVSAGGSPAGNAVGE